MSKTFAFVAASVASLAACAGQASAQCGTSLLWHEGGTATVVKAIDNRVYLANANFLRIYDSTVPTDLQLISTYYLDGAPEAIEKSGDTLFVALGTRGVEIIDVTNEAAPVQLYSLAGGDATDLAVSNDKLFIAWNGDLRIHDVTNPAAPGFLSTSPIGDAKFVESRGDNAFVATSFAFSGFIKVFDCSNASSPSLRSSTALGDPAVGLDVRSGTLAVSVDPGVGTRTLLYDTSNLNSLSLASVLLSPLAFYGSICEFGQIQGTPVLYFEGGPSRLGCVSLANPANPLPVPCDVALSIAASATSAGLLVCASYEQIRSYSTTLTAEPAIADTITSLGTATTDVAKIGTTMVCLENTVLNTFDATNPASPSLLSSFPLPVYYTDALAVQGNSAFVIGSDGGANDDELLTYDLSNPAAPVLLGSDTLRNWGYSIAVEGDLAAVLAWDTLDVYRITDPNRIRLLSSTPTPVRAFEVLVRDGVAIVLSEETYQLFDLADPAAPELLFTSAVSATEFVDMALRDDILFTAEYGGRIRATDITSPANPTLRSTIFAASEPRLILADSLVIASQLGETSAAIIDYADPTAPVLLSQTLRNSTGTHWRGLGIGGAVFVAPPSTGGYETLDLPGHPRLTEQPAEQPFCTNSPLVQLSVTAAEPAGTTYIWRRNGTPLTNGTTAWGTSIIGVGNRVLTFLNPRAQDTAFYDCIVTNACGSTTSRAGSLFPNTAPAVVNQPDDAFVCTRGETTFTVGWLGTLPATFQWQAEYPRGSGVWTDLSDGSLPRFFVSGATTRSLTVGATTGNTMPPFVEGNYRCIITNTCASTTSGAASLTLCIGDFDCSGGIDGDDVIAFFGLWDQSNNEADVTEDGGVDGDDVILFFERWDSGC